MTGTQNIGNTLNGIVYAARHAMFEQGELAQLTFGAFDIAAEALQQKADEEIEVIVPIGYKPDRTPMQFRKKFRKEELLTRYQYLASHQLTVNALIHLVTLVETMLGDVVRAVVMRYPQKLGGKRTVTVQAVLEATSLEEVHLRATDSFLNDLSYKSPAEFAEAVQSLLSVNLLECPGFHKYIEVKATRDIFVHSKGIANEVYVRKAGSHARVIAEMKLQADITYFLESYEHCLQVTDWLENELHDRWHSSEYEERQQPQLDLALKAPSSASGDGETNA